MTAVMLHFDRQQAFVPITPDTALSSLSDFFERHSAAFVVDSSAPSRVLHVVTKIDLLNFLFQLQAAKKANADGEQ